MKSLLKIRIRRNGSVVNYDYWHREFLFIGWWVPFKSIACTQSDPLVDKFELTCEEFLKSKTPHQLLGDVFNYPYNQYPGEITVI